MPRRKREDLETAEERAEFDLREAEEAESKKQQTREARWGNELAPASNLDPEDPNPLHQPLTTPDPAFPVQDNSGAGTAQTYAEALSARQAYERRRRRAVSVHHQLGELARERGAYPGEIMPLHQDAGIRAMLDEDVNDTPEALSASQAIKDGRVDPEATVIVAHPRGAAARYDPNE